MSAGAESLGSASILVICGGCVYVPVWVFPNTEAPGGSVARRWALEWNVGTFEDNPMSRPRL
jgi:hypothetical protein